MLSFVVLFQLDIPFWYPNRQWTLMLDYGLSSTTFEPPNHAFTFHSIKPHIHFYLFICHFQGTIPCLIFHKKCNSMSKKEIKQLYDLQKHY